jgi:tetrahedral aminopeptidase
MDAAAREFFIRLLETPSPSGYERPVQELVRDYVRSFADSVDRFARQRDRGQEPGAKLRVMFAGHCDQIGMLVTP